MKFSTLKKSYKSEKKFDLKWEEILIRNQYHTDYYYLASLSTGCFNFMLSLVLQKMAAGLIYDTATSDTF